MARTGRPKIEIDWEEFEKLCALHCTLIEIAEWFNCSEDTIERACKRHYQSTFADAFKKKSSKGKISLRRKMYELAMGGNTVMCIWLSKQVLGYTDKVEQKQEISADVKKNVYICEFPNLEQTQNEKTKTVANEGK